MSNLKEIYQIKSNYQLIEILEDAGNYSEEAISVVDEIFKSRNMKPEEVMSMVYEVNEKKVKTIIDNLDPVNDDINVHKSRFLNEEEVKAIYIQELERLMKEKEGFRFNVWLYALGG